MGNCFSYWIFLMDHHDMMTDMTWALVRLHFFFKLLFTITSDADSPDPGLCGGLWEPAADIEAELGWQRPDPLFNLILMISGLTAWLCISALRTDPVKRPGLMRTILFTEPSTRNLWTRVWGPGLSLCQRRRGRTDTTLAGVTSLLCPGRSQLTGTLLPGKTEQIFI